MLSQKNAYGVVQYSLLKNLLILHCLNPSAGLAASLLQQPAEEDAQRQLPPAPAVTAAAAAAATAAQGGHLQREGGLVLQPSGQGPGQHQVREGGGEEPQPFPPPRQD